jgi:hypothetical protein
MPSVNLTDRDREILTTLTQRIRCLSVVQLVAHWWPASEHALRSANRRIRELEIAGYLVRQRAFAKPLVPLTAPLVTWRPGEQPPDFAALSYRLKTRFSGAARQIPIVVATTRAADQFGGAGGRPPRASETTHDLGLAVVFLQLLRSAPERARGWVSEAALVRGDDVAAHKLPDALILEPHGEETVIEFGGEYSKAKLATFHQDCLSLARRYEVW